MLLSIIIPLYNTKDYIGECLESILCGDASLEQFEVIVVDDGSTDGSGNVVEDYQRHYPNLHLISQKNKGVSVARMNGIAAAQGDYTWFVDSDDYITDNAVRSLLDIIDTNPGTDVFVTPIRLVYDDPSRNFENPIIKERYEISGRDLLKDKELQIVAPHQFIIRRNLFKDKWLTFPVGIRYEDEYFSRVLKYRAGKCLILDKCLYCYRQWQGSHMHLLQIADQQDIIANYQHLDQFAKTEVAPDDHSWFRNNLVLFLLESLTRCSSLFHTTEFADFKRKNNTYLKSEVRKHRKCLSCKDQILAYLLLTSPKLYFKLLTWAKTRKC